MANLKARLLGGWIGDRLLRDARVEALEELGPRFRRVTLRALWEDAAKPGGDLGGAGQKVQVFLPDIGTRTYTPFDFEPATARFSLLVYLHGDTPGTSWGRALRVADPVRLVGPQASTPLDALRGSVALFGDETSFAVARTLRRVAAVGPQSTVRLEVSSREEHFPVADALEIPRDALVAKEAADAHLAPIARQLASAAPAGEGTVVLTGRASSIQTVRAHLRTAGNRKHTVRAYWADGKRGLD
jgi:NADPH-dependent ferric siderophore reductase